MTEKKWTVCPDCGAEDSVVSALTDPFFKIKKEMCSECGHNITGRVQTKSWENKSGWHEPLERHTRVIL